MNYAIIMNASNSPIFVKNHILHEFRKLKRPHEIWQEGKMTHRFLAVHIQADHWQFDRP
jgi:hypothetical protein